MVYPSGAEQRRGRVYFGCDGTYRALVEDIQCYKDGAPCSELELWKENMRQDMKKSVGCISEELSSSVLGAVLCRKARPENCDGNTFWHQVNSERNFACKKTNEDGGTTYLHKGSQSKTKGLDLMSKPGYKARIYK